MATLRTYLEDTYGENIRVAYRHFALSFHDKAPITGEAVEAAGAQGKFWEMHDLLYERLQEWGQLSVDAMPEKLTEYAAWPRNYKNWEPRSKNYRMAWLSIIALLLQAPPSTAARTTE